MPFLAPSAATSDTFRAVALALKLVPKDVRNDINRETRAVLSAIWIPAVTKRTDAMPEIDRKVLGKGTRVKPGNPVQLFASTSTRPLSGGLVPNEYSRGFEFGTDLRDKYTEYTRRSANGGSHTVSRRVGRHLPNRVRKGRAVFPAVAETVPRLTSLWVQIVVRKIYEAHEK
jgi:hypothetical protein